MKKNHCSQLQCCYKQYSIAFNQANLTLSSFIKVTPRLEVNDTFMTIKKGSNLEENGNVSDKIKNIFVV